MRGFADGWNWLTSAAHEEWVVRMKAGPWGEFLKRQQDELEAQLRARVAAKSSGEV